MTRSFTWYRAIIIDIAPTVKKKIGSYGKTRGVYPANSRSVEERLFWYIGSKHV
jgi:hypothetical protein